MIDVIISCNTFWFDRQDSQEKKTLCGVFSLSLLFFMITTFWALFFSRHSADRKEVHCTKTSAKEAMQRTSQKVLHKAWDAELLHLLCCVLNNLYLIPRQIYVKTSSFSQTHSIIIRFFERWPKFLMFIAMPGKIQNTGRYKKQIQFDEKTLELTSYPEHGDCIDRKQDNRIALSP